MPRDKHTEIIKDKTERAFIKCCWFVPKLPKSTTFRKWLPKHRHILFGHFGYWIFACLVTASSGTSLKTRCIPVEAAFMFITLVITSILVSIPKLLTGGFKEMFGPTIFSFLIMFSTALSLHQKPLICGFSNSSRRIDRKTANIWGIIVSLQLMVMLMTMLMYLMWHLKHKDEKRTAALEINGDSDADSDEDSMQGSPASVRWTAGEQEDEEANEDHGI